MNKPVDLSKGFWRVRFDPSEYETVAKAALKAGARGYDGYRDISRPQYGYEIMALYFSEGALTYLSTGSETFWDSSGTSKEHTEVFFYEGEFYERKFWTEPVKFPQSVTVLQPRVEWLLDRAKALTDEVLMLLCRRQSVPSGLRVELNQLLIDLED